MNDVHVLVPLDGSSLSEAILPVVRGLGASRVSLVRVIGKDAAAAEVESATAAVAERLRRDASIEVVAAIREGNPAEEILAAASDCRATLIAMTTHGRTGFDRLVLGSVAEKVIRAAPLPVLALRVAAPVADGPPAAGPLARVLVPCDGSETSWPALEALARLDDARRSKVLLFGVVEQYIGPTEIPPEVSKDLLVELRRFRRDGMVRELGRALARARELGFAAEVEVAVGSPAAAILDRAEVLPASLIAMATHGRSGLSRWALGSVTEKVLRASRTPLLICK